MAKAKYGLKTLCEDWGMDEEDILQEAVFDSVCPGICGECGYSTEVEPDQRRGWCEDCGKNTIQSALVLAGWI